jgi:hypothetical protein
MPNFVFLNMIKKKGLNVMSHWLSFSQFFAIKRTIKCQYLYKYAISPCQWLLCHNITNFSVRQVAPYHHAIIINYASILNIMCTCSMFILREKHILTFQVFFFFRSIAVSIQYYKCACFLSESSGMQIGACYRHIVFVRWSLASLTLSHIS